MLTENEHLLVTASEECSEIIKEIDKSLRFGLKNYHPAKPEETNADRIIKEYYQLVAVMEMLFHKNVLPKGSLSDIEQIKIDKKLAVMEYMEKAKTEFGTVIEKPVVEYKTTIYVEKSEANEMTKLLTTNPETKEECFTGTKSYTGVFENGFEIDVKICGVDFEDPEFHGARTDNKPYTEAVLFDKGGSQISFPEPSDEFFGKWEFEFESDDRKTRYIADVKIKP